MKYSDGNGADVSAATTQEAAQQFSQRRANKVFGGNAVVRTVCYDHASNEGTWFHYESIIAPESDDHTAAIRVSVGFWVSGTHRIEAGRVMQVATFKEAHDQQIKAVSSGDKRNLAQPGTLYGYARMALTDKMLCVGMIADAHRDLYGEHFAGLLPHQPGTAIATGERSLFALVPEYLGQHISEADARLVSRVEYERGRMVSNREHLSFV